MLLCARHSRRPPQIPTLQSCSLYYCGQIVYPIYKHPYSSAAQQSAEPFVTTCQTQPTIAGSGSSSSVLCPARASPSAPNDQMPVTCVSSRRT